MNIPGMNNNMNWGTLSKSSQSKSLESNDSKENGSITLNNQNKKYSYSALEKTKENLVKMKEELMGKEMPPEEKKFKLEEINKQLIQIDAEIQNAKNLEREREEEKLKKKIEEKQAEKSQSKDEVVGGVIVSESLKKLIETGQTMESIRNLKVTKANLKVEKGWLTPDGNPNSFVTKQYNKLAKGISGIEQRISSESAKLVRNVSNIKVDSKDDKNIEINQEEVKEENQNKDENKKQEIGN